MGILVIEGFEGYTAVTNDGADLARTIFETAGQGWVTAAASDGLVAGRYGGKAANHGSTSTGARFAISQAGVGTVTIGFAFQHPTALSSQTMVVQFLDPDQTIQCTLQCGTDNKLRFYRGSSTTLLATGTLILAAGAWYYIEVTVVFGNTGSYTVKIDGQTEFTAASVDTTQSTAHQTCGFVGVMGSPSQLYFDDLYIRDDSTMMGPIRVQSLVPTASASPAQFDAVGGAFTSRGLDRSGQITITTTITIVNGTTSNMVDGALTSALADYVSWGAGASSREIKFNFGSPTIITGARWLYHGSASHGTWKWQGSNDDSTYTDIGSAFTFSTTNGVWITNTELAGNTTAYQYYKLVQTSGTTSVGGIGEIEFAHADAGAASGVSEEMLDSNGYIQGATGEAHEFTLGDLVGNNTNTVKAVQIAANAYKTDAGALTLNVGIDSAGTESDGTAFTLREADFWFKRIFATDPATGAAWTAGAVNALKARVSVP